jgi:hypothetical protein
MAQLAQLELIGEIQIHPKDDVWQISDKFQAIGLPLPNWARISLFGRFAHNLPDLTRLELLQTYLKQHHPHLEEVHVSSDPASLYYPTFRFYGTPVQSDLTPTTTPTTTPQPKPVNVVDPAQFSLRSNRKLVID